MADVPGRAGYERVAALRMKAASEYALAAEAMEQALACEPAVVLPNAASVPALENEPPNVAGPDVAGPNEAAPVGQQRGPEAADRANQRPTREVAPSPARHEPRRKKARRDGSNATTQHDWDRKVSKALWGVVRRGRAYEGKNLAVARDGSADIYEAAELLNVDPDDLTDALLTFPEGWELAEHNNERRFRAHGIYHGQPQVSSVHLELPICCWAKPGRIAASLSPGAAPSAETPATLAEPNAEAQPTTALLHAKSKAPSLAQSSTPGAQDPRVPAVPQPVGVVADATVPNATWPVEPNATADEDAWGPWRAQDSSTSGSGHEERPAGSPSDSRRPGQSWWWRW